jgi:hypothetical protein
MHSKFSTGPEGRISINFQSRRPTNRFLSPPDTQFIADLYTIDDTPGDAGVAHNHARNPSRDRGNVGTSVGSQHGRQGSKGSSRQHGLSAPTSPMPTTPTTPTPMNTRANVPLTPNRHGGDEKRRPPMRHQAHSSSTSISTLQSSAMGVSSSFHRTGTSEHRHAGDDEGDEVRYADDPRARPVCTWSADLWRVPAFQAHVRAYERGRRVGFYTGGCFVFWFIIWFIFLLMLYNTTFACLLIPHAQTLSSG